MGNRLRGIVVKTGVWLVVSAVLGSSAMAEQNPSEKRREALEKLCNVKVASLYERVNDGVRSLDEVIEILKETKTDFVFRGWFTWQPCPAEDVSQLPTELRRPIKSAGPGYSYRSLKDAIARIKDAMPEVIFCGAFSGLHLNPMELNPLTGRIYQEDEVRKMALDADELAKKGLERFRAQMEGFLREGAAKRAYCGDVTDPEYRDLLLSWAKLQIDCGVDAIWIDLLFGPAERLEQLVGNAEHPAVKALYEGATEVIDEIHKYGLAKGKYISVGSWPARVRNLDFVTLPSPVANEIRNRKLDERKWNDWMARIESTRKEWGKDPIPIFTFIDWWWKSDCPINVFSQELTPEEQQEFLKVADEFFGKRGINFVYPVHGGPFWGAAMRRSFGKYGVYDSLAPEFRTYEAIKELALRKSEMKADSTPRK